uniref:Ribonuclease H-like domain-containing protein n=1 Tax=Tanacetum cinerariifolium TaxID=118510 RepID=A0A6L2MKH0_TANCI|nr:ribonuclease H-like domain-containing protein [Tanacetum cinerariifolium]
MSVHGNTDNEFVNEVVNDPVTLISRHDMSESLHSHPNDSTALTVVSIKLKGTGNYQASAFVYNVHVEVNLCGLLELGKNDLSLNEYLDHLGSFGS